MKKIINILIFWLIVIALSLLPLSLTRIGLDLYLLPQIEIGLAFFLSIYTRVLPVQLFLYGLLIDVAYSTHIGISALILLMINRIICRFKSNLSKQNIGSILFYFSITTILVGIFKYIIFAFESSNYNGYNIKIIIINLIINIAFYPILHIALLYSPYIDNSQKQ